MHNNRSVFNWQLFVGIVFVVTGGLFLADQFLEVELMRYYWPLLIVLFGATFLVGMLLAKKRGAWLAIPGAVIMAAGLILFIHNTFDLWITWTYAWALLISAVGVGMLLMNIYLKHDGLRKAAGWVIGIGLTLFVVFGVLFEIIFDMAGSSVKSGVFMGSGLVLLGIFIVLSKWIFADRPQKGEEEIPAEPVEEVPEEVPEPSPEIVEEADIQEIPEPSPEIVEEADIQEIAEPQPETLEEAAVSSGEDSEFSRFVFKGAGDVYLEQGSTCDWTVEGDPGLVESVKAEIIDETLSIKVEDDEEGFRDVTSLLEESQLHFHVHLKSLSGVTLSGTGSITADQLTGERLDILHTGEGQLILKDMDYQGIQVAHEGLGLVELAGEVQTQDVDLTGLGTYDAENLKSQDANVNVSGAGTARVWVEGELNASLDGAGSILYKGEPFVEKSVTGLGSVKPLET